MINSERKLTRTARALAIREKIIEDSAEHGRWFDFKLRDGRPSKAWCIDLGDGLQAYIMTRFSALGDGAPAGLKAQVIGRASKWADLILLVYDSGYRKVLSIESHDGVHTVISMTPGPWEASFGLPHRDWTPSMARRIARSAAA